jgi:hypothetical protein
MAASSQIEAIKLLAMAYQNACHSSHPSSAFAMRITHSALTQAKRELFSK